MGRVALDVGNIDTGAMLMQVVKKFLAYSPGSATMVDVASDDDMRAAATGCWPAACGIKPGGEVCCLRLPCR